MVQISESSPTFFSKKKTLSEKMPATKIKSFLITLFNPNQTLEIMLTKNLEIWNFSANDTPCICIKVLRKTLKLQKRSKY